MKLDIEARCFTCRKKPTNCTCFEYRIKRIDKNHAAVFVDNCCAMPVNDDETGTWQPRANATLRRRAIYIDGFGPVLYINENEDHQINRETVKVMIEEGTFHYDKFRGRAGFRVPTFDREVVRRYAFLRKPRQHKKIAA